MTSRSTRIVLAAATAATGAVVSWVASRRALVQAAAPDLRNPLLYVPAELAGPGGIPVFRRLLAAAPGVEPPEGVRLRHRQVTSPDGHSVDVCVYEPAQRAGTTGALLWAHDGGHVAGSPEFDHGVCGQLAADLGILVVSVEYRLAPEHPFPADLDDCYAALRWLQDQASSLRIDPARIAVGGAGAGGGLAACLAQRAHDERHPVAFQVLLYPMLDDRTVLDPVHPSQGRLGWTKRSNDVAWEAYLGQEPGHTMPEPYAAAARRVDLAGLPPAWVGVGDLDLFYEESRIYARRLARAGVAAEFHAEPGVFHGAEPLVGESATMRAFRDRAVAALDAAFRGSAALTPAAPHDTADAGEVAAPAPHEAVETRQQAEHLEPLEPPVAAEQAPEPARAVEPPQPVQAAQLAQPEQPAQPAQPAQPEPLDAADGPAPRDVESAASTTQPARAGRRVSALDEVRDGGYGVGSAAPIADGAIPLGHRVKAWEDTKTFVAPGHPIYDDPDPHVWFTDEAAARRAGFRPVG